VIERRLDLSTGIAMNVALAGPASGPPAIFLHGFPESHRTWRFLVPRLEQRIRMIMPDLRGFGASDQPQDVADYSIDTLLADLFALADALGIERFALVGHDWGGAVAWAAAIRGDPRVERLAIVNSPHPLIYQRSLIEDRVQRRAAQYIRAFRDPKMEAGIEAMGYPAFFEKTFNRHVDPSRISPDERERYIGDWSRPGSMTAMLNWYRASRLVVPAMDEEVPLPAWVERGNPKIRVPVRVVWGLEDRALPPVQLEGMGEVGDDVEIYPLKGIGHFAPWEAPDEVAAALAPFLAPD
jgi:pimeloyl-ACP methyl ester carboxylesterase